jgi:hypothetical protein
MRRLCTAPEAVIPGDHSQSVVKGASYYRPNQVSADEFPGQRGGQLQHPLLSHELAESAAVECDTGPTMQGMPRSPDIAVCDCQISRPWKTVFPTELPTPVATTCVFSHTGWPVRHDCREVTLRLIPSNSKRELWTPSRLYHCCGPPWSLATRTRPVSDRLSSVFRRRPSCPPKYGTKSSTRSTTIVSRGSSCDACRRS